ncbi:20458_t:CDS:2 [Gigaspora margarita]|uniref:20458_t:CDS:1 n=1 Tax=Gigaspora margarita TaxID=4874 RepID=A0ABN7VSM4_GIGMA|nr:20458_t:CDS:2 [Gigaspora margarita]
MNIMKNILYATTETIMIENYNELKTNYYYMYLQLQRHFKSLWNRQQFWAVLFRSGLSLWTHCHPSHVRIARKFLCPSCEAIDATKIQQTKISVKYLVPSQKQGVTEDNWFYASLHAYTNNYQHESNINQVVTNIGINTVNEAATKIGINTMDQAVTEIGMNITGQATTNIGINTINQAVTEIDMSTINQVVTEIGTNITDQAATEISTYIIDLVVTEIGMNTMNQAATKFAFFEKFLRTIKDDYENCGPQLQAALEKLAEKYNAAKTKSIPALMSFFYSINRKKDLLVQVKSGAKIHVQVKSVKYRKTESDAKKSNNKENNDSHAILAQKVWAVSKRNIVLVKILAEII